MERLSDYPLVLFAVALVSLWLASVAGRWLRDRALRVNSPRSDDFDVIAGATLSLLALIVGFTFSMAASRYDQRRNLEAVEANTIGTEFLRASLLPAPDAARVRSLLAAYVDQRILFFESEGGEGAAGINRQTDQLATALWASVRDPGVAQPTPMAALVVAGMNDVLDSRGYTQAALWNRIPTAAWVLMAVIALCCNVLLGYGSRESQRWKTLGVVLPFCVAISFLLIADIDAPQRGLIRVTPEDLRSLVQPFRAPEPAPAHPADPPVPG